MTDDARLTWYAVKHWPTGRYLPRPGNKNTQKGGSYVELCDPLVKPPRLFETWRSARNYLTQWLRGPVEPAGTESADEGFGIMATFTTFKPKHDPSRKLEEMEIVTLKVMVPVGPAHLLEELP